MNKLGTNAIKAHYDIEIRTENNLKTYTNGDIIKGEVVFTVAPDDDDTAVSSIAISLKAIAHTMLEDASSAPAFEGHGETHDLLNVSQNVFPTEDLLDVSKTNNASYSFPAGVHKYPFEFRLPEDEFNLQCSTEGGFLHKRGFLKDDQVTPPVTLPPSLIYEKGISNYARIEYSVDVLVQKSPSSKPNVEAKLNFTFLPKFNLVTFNTSKVSNQNVSGKSFEFKYKENGDVDAEKGSLFKTILKKALPVLLNNKVTSLFELQAAFIPHLEPYNTQFNSSRFLQAGDNLSQVVRLSVLTTLSYSDLIKKIHPSNANTSSENLSFEPETLVLNKLKIKLISNLMFKSQIFNETRGFRTILVNRDNINYPISHKEFQNIGALSAQNSSKSGSSSSTSRLPRLSSTSKLNTEFYKFDIPPELYNAPVNALLPSFVTCNIKVQHRLHITAKFTSTYNPKQSAIVKLKPDIILLKDYYKTQYKYEESLPVYTANYDSSDEE